MAEQNPRTGEEQPAPAQQQAEVVLNDKEAHAAYSNFARVTATPEEVIIDFGLNPNPFLAGRQEVNVSQRLIMNFYTAKRLCSALAMTMGMEEVAALMAAIAWFRIATITSGFRRTTAAASAGRRSIFPSAHQRSRMMFRPST